MAITCHVGPQLPPSPHVRKITAGRRGPTSHPRSRGRSDRPTARGESAALDLATLATILKCQVLETPFYR